MKIRSNLVGTRLKAYHTDISWRHTMNYAAAVGDKNPCYFDDERDQGIIAPPMFCVAVTWPVVERTWRNLAKDDLPAEIMSTLVHYTEHLVFHQPLTPGDSLTLQAEIVALLPHKAGTLIVIRTDAFDNNGAPVFTEHNGGLFRGVEFEGEGQGEKSLPPIPSREDGGGSIWRSQIYINPMQNFIYDGCTNIVFPIHTSKKFARRVGLPDIILHGTATLALAVRELVNKEAAMDPVRLQALSCRFTGMVLPATDIWVELAGKEVKKDHTDVFFTVRNQERQKIISEGYASLKNK
jgi:acyl dehydratase